MSGIKTRVKPSRLSEIVAENADKTSILNSLCAFPRSTRRMSLSACKTDIFGHCLSADQHGMVIASNGF